MLIEDAEVLGHGRVDCRVEHGRITEIGAGLEPVTEDSVIRAGGGALLPGLADHHLHLAAMAAHDASTDLDGVADPAAALAEAAPDGSGWIRAVGLDDPDGDLDRHRLDACTGDVPTRVQHRSGALWVLNTAGLERLGAAAAGHGGIERDPAGSPTGRLWRADDWMGHALDESTDVPRSLSLRSVGRRLAGYGITDVADASPGDAHLPVVLDAVSNGDLPQHVLVMCGATAPSHPRIAVGPVKVVVADHDLPTLDDLVDRVRQAHAQGRAVAVHCVTRTSLALTLAALDVAGVCEGDRIEHCAVAGPDLIGHIAARGLRVVTQPALMAQRGDDYRERSDPADREDLWPYRALLAAGVRTAPSSDAPYGVADPWACLRAAAGLGVPARTALDGMLSALDDPGGVPRRIEVGAPADLVLLDRPLDEALRRPDHRYVRATVIDGLIAYRSPGA